MIRDLTKSILSFSWAMSLFGTKQLANASTPEKATRAFDAVTEATEEQLGDVLKGAFRAGDHLQRGVVDVTLGLLTLQTFNPSQVMKMASDMMQQTTGTPGNGAQGDPRPHGRTTGWGPATGTSGHGTQGGPSPSQDKTTGWGPMPPAGVK
jgi:hypothetical protein